ncbi:type II toxin-antitoxin system RelE/ParE family toxin [Xenorhabdus szentirmaii]|uniref:Uncharacterized protein n=1 Tax=Xenorhabdus szentirmaii DSM 16338 TaxID=1427518 RepID=W1IT75_9GAMM|nr:type II toxin-antitoxin system RelE/ParE family toxin [Xenorhabdus szentirmaii]PHM30557.1 plasmid stabilization protein [Xenorhabdus szentirmaii DSM 16338]CDL81023.1 conserved hypothetical protein [Xenorhabdus szentirmaii DSM 16338]
MRRWGINVAEASEDLYFGVRSFPVESHIIYYQEVPAGIEVLAVLHQTQDPHNLY